MAIVVFFVLMVENELIVFCFPGCFDDTKMQDAVGRFQY
jgi:hypothetical protein